jgi:hypothetical protein
LREEQKQNRGRKPPANEKGKTMKNNKSWLVVLAAVAAFASAQTGRAITYGQADRNLHPNAGAWMVNWPDGTRDLFGSGTLIYKATHRDGSATGVFLTAGHITADIQSGIDEGWAEMDYVRINFNPDPLPHPEQDIRVVEVFSFFVPRSDIGAWDDVGVAVLKVKKAKDLPEPATLAPVGFLDQFTQSELHESLLVVVGYGATLLRPPAELVYENKRQFSTPKYQKCTDTVVTLQANGPAGNSGWAMNDSGGPLFWKEPRTGRETVIGIDYGVNNVNFNSMAYSYRADTQVVHDFIQAVIDGL